MSIVADELQSDKLYADCHHSISTGLYIFDTLLKARLAFQLVSCIYMSGYRQLLALPLAPLSSICQLWLSTQDLIQVEDHR